MDPDSSSLDHAKAGYANSQEVIRFLDTKAGALIALATGAIAFGVLTVKWFLELGATSSLSVAWFVQNSPHLFCFAACAVCLGVLVGAIAIWCCLHSLNARPPKFDRAHGKRPPILFPLFNPKDRTQLRSAHRSFARLRRPLHGREIAAEYELQLRRIGTILHEKVCCLRSAVRFIEGQLILYVVALGLIVAAKW